MSNRSKCGIMIALHAIQADNSAIHGLKSKYLCGCFLFCARGIMIALNEIQSDFPVECRQEGGDI